MRRATARNPLLSRRSSASSATCCCWSSPESAREEDRAEQRRFAGKFQQVTAPVMAKGVEDTAFYVYNRLVSLNEVGGDPAGSASAPRRCTPTTSDRQARWPYALSPLSTHDTKRSEDVRARINVLSEMPERLVGRRRALEPAERAAPHGQVDDDQPIPDANEEYLLYQTLVGAWPLEPYGRRGIRRVRQADPGLHAQGPARGQGAHELDQPQRRVRRGHPASSSAASSTRTPTAAFLDDFRAVPAPGQPATACSTRCRRRC